MVGRASDLHASVLTLKTLLSFIVRLYLVTAHPADQSLALADGKGLQQTLVYLHILAKDITQLETTCWGRDENKIISRIRKSNMAKRRVQMQVFLSFQLCRQTCVLLEITATCKIISVFPSCRKIFVHFGSRICSDEHFACCLVYSESRLISSDTASSPHVSVDLSQTGFPFRQRPIIVGLNV